MKTLLLALSLPFLILSLSPAWAKEEAESHLPARIVRCLRGVTLTDAQQASMQSLNSEFERRMRVARKLIAAHEMAKWRLGIIELQWYERVDALLTAEQKQIHFIEALKEPTTIEFVETPLKDVVEYLGDLHRIRVELDRPALRSAEQGTDLAITANLRGVTLDSALRLTLRQVGLMHVVQDDRLLITTEEEGRKLVQRGAAVSPEIKKEFLAATKKLAMALRVPSEVAFAETSLKHVVDCLKDLHHVEIQLDSRALRAAGIEPDSTCTIHLKGATLDTVLKSLLGKLGAKYVIQDEVILITADAPANPQPLKPPADPTRFRPHPAEHEAVERLLDLCPSCSLNRHDDGRIAWLQMKSSDASDEVLALAGKLDRLEAFSNEFGEAAASRTTDRGLASLRTASRLSELTLRGEMITDAGVVSLAELAHLRKLSLGETDITDAGVKQLGQLAELQELDLIGTRVDGSGFAAKRNMENLKKLFLCDTLISDANLKYLDRFADLEVLRLATTRIDGSGLAIIATLPRLKELNLNDTRVTDAGLSHLRGATSLESLGLQGTAVTDAGLGQLAALPNLKVLDLSGTRITDAGLRRLASLGGLTSLQLAHTQVTDAGLKTIAALTHLRSLELGGTRITDAGLANLRTLDKLTFLGINETGITEAGLASLREFPNINWVNASKTPTSEKARRELNRVLAQRSSAHRNKEGQTNQAEPSGDPFGR